VPSAACLCHLCLGLALVACTAPPAKGPALSTPDQSGGEAQGDVWAERRAQMVEAQIERRGVKDPRVLDAMRRVPRHLFVPPIAREASYEDYPLSIGLGQTISQPFIVAYMTEALKLTPTDRVLEIGTGSGYQAAILAELARDVYTIEILPELAERARATLASLGYKNVNVRAGNGYLGWPEAAPFDKIIVTAAPDDVPAALVEQLGPGGVMIVPVGTAHQMLTIVTRTPAGLVRRETMPVVFVPMVGKPKP
jgi:protein-L-isoaspartate(D-aspartate) O-methyltransferase